MKFLSTFVAGACLAAILSSPARAQEPESPPADVNPVTTESGLQYSILKAGKADGRKPQWGDQVTVQYKGWLENGEVFDSSFKRGQPAKFKVGDVIEGWNEGLGFITEGGQIKLSIPANLAYGESERQGIPANSRLIFFVELVAVTAGPPVPPFEAVVKEDTKVNKTEAGVEWRLIKTGEGETCGPTQTAKFALTCWNAEGKVLICRTPKNGGVVTASGSQLRFPFIKGALGTLNPGAIGLFSVPAGQDWPKDQRPPMLGTGPSVWRIELVEIPFVPEFKKLDPEKTVTTESGLKYQVIEAGEGTSPTAASRVRCHYAGWLVNGTSFDSSFSRGQPTDFGLNQVIKGWTEGVQAMKPGGKFLFEIPGDLAYGARGRPPTIPADATLIFYIELIEVL